MWVGGWLGNRDRLAWFDSKSKGVGAAQAGLTGTDTTFNPPPPGLEGFSVSRSSHISERGIVSEGMAAAFCIQRHGALPSTTTFP